jgi:CRISPR-associated protein (TIGR02584 family)
MSPSQFPRRILLCVTGMSPQIVTETLYALVTEQTMIPTEIRIITTVQGRNRLVSDLLDPVTGQFHAFCKEYGLGGQICFDADSIAVITDAQGNALPDIRTPEENTLAADFITAIVRDLCADEDAALHVSIAGGRKSMGFYLGYALSLFARPQDRLSHVLINEPFESLRDFFFPYKTPRTIIDARGVALDTAEARVMLADIPLVRLRDGLPDQLLGGETSYCETVRIAQSFVDVHLAFNLPDRLAILGGQPLKLPPILLAFLLWMARLRVAGKTIRPDDAHVEEFLAVYEQVAEFSGYGDFANTRDGLRKDPQFEHYFREKRAKLNRSLGKMASKYHVVSQGKKGQTAYFLAIDPSKITLPRS